MGHLVIEPSNGDVIHDREVTFVGRAPIREGFATQSPDGKPVAPLMGQFRQYDGGVTGLMSYPWTWFAACNDHALLVRFTAISVNQTDVRYTWLVHPDAVEGRDYDLGRLTWLWRTTGEQDRLICEWNHAGVSSPAYEPGPYSAAEHLVDGFVQWYLNRLQKANP